mmetsp:Transcript_15344/g.41716  ORF Transcript_15344/g.41716 Transcript_15344/m.41716 type:complete len:278 (+) Transcript_15344:2-835(+)
MQVVPRYGEFQVGSRFMGGAFPKIDGYQHIYEIASSPSDCSDSWSPIDTATTQFEQCDGTYRKERHRMVERNRRDKTRGYVSQLQELLPNPSDKSSNPNINVILENVLEYLQSLNINDESKDEEAVNDSVHSNETVPRSWDVRDQLMNAFSGSPLGDIAGRRFNFAFENAPVGIVMARCNGTVFAANPAFENYFRFAKGCVLGRTMFEMTSPQDVQRTMQAACALLSGNCESLSLTKHCMKADGQCTELLFVNMRLIWRDGRPHSLLCHIRPALRAV